MLQFKQLSEQALLVYVGDAISEQTHYTIQAYMTQLQAQPFDGLIEIVPSYTNFCVYYDPFIVKKAARGKTASQHVQQHITNVLQHAPVTTETRGRLVEIPVYYGGEYGPDLAYVAQVNGLTPDQVIAIHTATDYFVYMLGFAPGFPFLGGLDKRIATPRRTTPRLEIAAGSVGIAGEQTGIYPLATPGGWQIIGRTMAQLFLPTNNPPTLLQAGDRIRFVAQQWEAHA